LQTIVPENAPENVVLKPITWPHFDPQPIISEITCEELEQRIERLRIAMRERGLTHLLIYGDREHFANLMWACHLDPRFEEALLVVRADAAGDSTAPLLLVGNECQSYLPVSPLFRSGKLRTERYQTFSLLDQPRNASRSLQTILGDEGISAGDRVGCVGFKYYESEFALDLPAYLVDALRQIVGADQVVSATDLFLHPAYGFRTRCSAWEIAYFEASNWKASEAMRRVIFAVKEGIADGDLLNEVHYDGTPLSCHMTCKTGPNRISLASPRGDLVQKGYPWSANIAFWGSNVCRAGWVAHDESDLPQHAHGYLQHFAKPYYAAMAAWLQSLRIGIAGAEIYEMVHARLPFETFGIFLNPGHLIHYDEWTSSPIFQGSTIPIASGMVFQSDIIPSSKQYFSSRMEEGYVVADAALQAEIQTRFPGCFSRCMSRRQFMAQTLGIALPAEVLPLSNICGIVAPFVLNPQQVLALG